MLNNRLLIKKSTIDLAAEDNRSVVVAFQKSKWILSRLVRMRSRASLHGAGNYTRLVEGPNFNAPALQIRVDEPILSS